MPAARLSRRRTHAPSRRRTSAPSPTRPLIHRRLLPAALGLLLATGLTLVAAPAQAHDELVASNPADRATVATLPDQVVLTFEEPAEQVGSQVIVRGPGGNVAQGAPVFAGSKVTQAIRPGAPAGRYTVLWRVTSDDGHPVSGSFTFTASAGSATPTPTGTTATAPVPTATTPAASPSAPSTSGSGSGSGSGSSRWVALLVILVLLVPVALFVRRGAALSGRGRED